MCESAAYVLKEGREDLLLEGVEILEDLGAQIRVGNIYGETETLSARVKVLSLVDHKILLEPIP